jgi:hypothetical protein
VLENLRCSIVMLRPRQTAGLDRARAVSLLDELQRLQRSDQRYRQLVEQLRALVDGVGGAIQSYHDTMTMSAEDEVRAERVRRAAEGRGAWRRYAAGRDLVAELIAERRAAAAAEEPADTGPHLI